MREGRTVETTAVLDRWQFAVTIVYHFLFVPITIGLAWFVAGMQTAWHRTGKEHYLRMTRFFGKLFLINFALGVVTGIVQEFQFGMNWSVYSRFVGAVFGAPLAIEGLVAFFLESTFIGLWIFGWDRLSPRLHLAMIWLVVAGTTSSAYFILAANSWMQRPVGFAMRDGRAEMTSLGAVLLQPLQITHFLHTIAASLITAGLLVIAASAYRLRRGRREGGDDPDATLFRAAARGALRVTAGASVVVILVGHFQAQILVKDQPMKMAAAEALYETQAPAPLSLLAIGPWEKHPDRTDVDIVLPHGLSVLSTNEWNGEIRGINDIQREYRARYGPGDYTPIIGSVYWSWRVMITIGFLLLLYSVLWLWIIRRRGWRRSRWFALTAYAFLGLPFLANTAGWLLTEMGRQPWIVQGLLRTHDAISPRVGSGQVIATLAGFAAVYGVLAAIMGWLMVRAIRTGPEPAAPGVTREDALPPMLY
ncbi:cytochrome ubiquinol oxidase subunit I [Actinomadura geliboluensis]|jgi:cytochrome d ubiquinol oxidase subunit I|uniref:Cytochrome ubiquinol oxidase subunit I n=1 Tax=Actinomadura geliboluensis TaxID=882440 RepID=A0A5S4H645_9ACTN|nr:cytochrome ubiquinol oxidase subunit I [Actinomadura geliboluensis]TMR40191.1 cytochrome ubiquinol oxidase subunit I [Actinomadura geliboluensis]